MLITTSLSVGSPTRAGLGRNGSAYLLLGQSVRFNGCGLVTAECLDRGWATCPNSTFQQGLQHLSAIGSDDDGSLELVLSVETQCYTLNGYDIGQALKSSDPECALFLPSLEWLARDAAAGEPGLRLKDGCLDFDADDLFLGGFSVRASLEVAVCLSCNIDEYSGPGEECTACPLDTHSTGNASSCTTCRACEEGTYRVVSAVEALDACKYMSQLCSTRVRAQGPPTIAALHAARHAPVDTSGLVPAYQRERLTIIAAVCAAKAKKSLVAAVPRKTGSARAALVTPFKMRPHMLQALARRKCIATPAPTLRRKARCQPTALAAAAAGTRSRMPATTY